MWKIEIILSYFLLLNGTCTTTEDITVTLGPSTLEHVVTKMMESNFVDHTFGATYNFTSNSNGEALIEYNTSGSPVKEGLTEVPEKNSLREAPQPPQARDPPRFRGTAKEQQILDHIYNFFNYYYNPIVVIVGLFGNAFILAVINSGSMRSHSSSVYLTALAAADLILSFGRFPMVLSNVGMAEYEGYRNFYKPIVVTCMYVFSIGEWTSVWIKVFLAVERFVVIRFPLKAGYLSTIRRARIAVCVPFAINAMLCTIFFHMKTAVEQYDKRKGIWAVRHRPSVRTTFEFDSNYRIFHMLYVHLIPFATMFILHILIIRTLIKSTRTRKLMATQQTATAPTTGKTETTITSLLITILIVYFIFTLPVVIHDIASQVIDNRHLGSFLWELSKYGAPISFSVGALNVFLFSMMSQQFRNEASRMCKEACCFHWRKSDHVDSSNSTSQKQTAQTNVSSHI